MRAIAIEERNKPFHEANHPTVRMRRTVCKTRSECAMQYRAIGTIHTPYSEQVRTPYQPLETDEDAGVFFVELVEKYVPALTQLNEFKYIYLIYHIDRLRRDTELIVTPPWAGGMEVGLFASRSPLRPNPIGLSIVKLRSGKFHRVYTSNLDVFDGTPLLDIKPYIQHLDSKPDANHGWIDRLPDSEHLTLHIRGVPHDY
jgi:tRNA-Thr(GGU) m(6)t(6)A37 methyltransferase TsaA